MTGGCPEPGSSRHTDLTLEQARALLQEREHELAALRVAQEAFIGTVAHDLRAPLRHITSYGALVRELLQEGAGLGAEAQQEALDFVGTMAHSAQRMGHMLDGLLALSRIARAPLQPQAVALGELVAQVQGELAGGAADRMVDWQCAPDLPSVQGDAALLRQLLAELLGNALKFTRGCAPARIAVTGERCAGGVLLRVHDNGVGFEPARAAGLFGVFQRLHREAEFEGVGAGLAAVHAIAQRHGGSASATAQPGAGCTVTVQLPG